MIINLTDGDTRVFGIMIKYYNIFFELICCKRPALIKYNDVQVSPHKIIGFAEKSTHADHPANAIHKSVIGRDIKRQRFVRTGCTNLRGRNIAIAKMITTVNMTQKFG